MRTARGRAQRERDDHAEADRRRHDDRELHRPLQLHERPLPEGSVRDFRIYDHALTAAEVAAFAPVSDADRVTRDAASPERCPRPRPPTSRSRRAGPYGTTIAWASDDPAAISNTGVVTLAKDPKTVTLPPP